ncbi:hypothetical protein GGR50DRAFT_189454 [Xylaria sp. CBS 124048]|nr:hypothetical protein GGR50DRAFT_189454 [Xylaria sp. CBS 124048]
MKNTLPYQHVVAMGVLKRLRARLTAPKITIDSPTNDGRSINEQPLTGRAKTRCERSREIMQTVMQADFLEHKLAESSDDENIKDTRPPHTLPKTDYLHLFLLLGPNLSNGAIELSTETLVRTISAPPVGLADCVEKRPAVDVRVTLDAPPEILVDHREPLKLLQLGNGHTATAPPRPDEPPKSLWSRLCKPNRGRHTCEQTSMSHIQAGPPTCRRLSQSCLTEIKPVRFPL